MYISFHFLNSDSSFTIPTTYYNFINLKIVNSHFEDTLRILSCSP